MTDYERIKQTCLEKGELWEDPDFPANQSSVFYYQTPSFVFGWKRSKVFMFCFPSLLLKKEKTEWPYNMSEHITYQK